MDSPGIGENPVMDSVIKRFVANNEINGFIYLIKSNSGSRVDEDRVGFQLHRYEIYTVE